MIVCVCLSPAIDVTYRVDRLVPGATVRVGAVTERAGGKAVNVARVLHQLGEDVLLVAPTGGETGEQLREALAEAGLRSRLLPDRDPTRRTVTVVDADGVATCLVEPAGLDCWPELLEAVDESLVGARVLVVSGSMPRGVPVGGLTALVVAAHSRGLPVVADTHGPALVEALEARCDLVKPNADELAHVTDGDDPVRAARGLVDRYGSVVVVSHGADGVVATTSHGTWEARPSAPVIGNPTGAGDALVAGLARGLARDRAALDDPEEALRDAVALSVAAVRSPAAGEIDLAAYADELAGVTVRAWGGVG